MLQPALQIFFAPKRKLLKKLFASQTLLVTSSPLLSSHRIELFLQSRLQHSTMTLCFRDVKRFPHPLTPREPGDTRVNSAPLFFYTLPRLDLALSDYLILLTSSVFPHFHDRQCFPRSRFFQVGWLGVFPAFGSLTPGCTCYILVCAFSVQRAS